MKKLEKNWFVTGLLDFEYKSYILLDYIKFVNQEYKENKLFPTYSNLLTVYKSTLEFKQILNSFKTNITTKSLVGIDWVEEKLVYENRTEQGFELTDEIESIIDYSLPIFKETVSKGKDIYALIDSSISLDCVGIEPINRKEGYVIVRTNKTNYIYKYNICLLKDSNEFSLPIEFNQIAKKKSTLSKNIDKLKIELNAKNKNSLATYFCEVDGSIPLEETALHIIKRKLNSVINS